MAYAALVSLAQTLHQILLRHQHSFISLHEKQQIQSLHEKIVFLSNFLEDYPGEATKLETRITIAANQIEDIFELHVLSKNSSKYGKRGSNVLICFHLALLSLLFKEYLEKPIKEINSILKEAMEIVLICFVLALLSLLDSLFWGRNLKKLFKEYLEKPIKEINSILKEAMEIVLICFILALPSLLDSLFWGRNLKKLFKEYLEKPIKEINSILKEAMEIVLICFVLALPSLLDSLFWGRNLKKLFKEYLEKPIKEINSILKEAMEIKSRCASVNEMMSTHSSASVPSTLAPNLKGAVVGFEKDLLEIKERLYGESAKLEVIPIVGMGGIGKTTLARYALHDPFTRHHFDVSAFVSVSQIFDKASILSCLLKSIDPSVKAKFGDLSFKDEHVYKYLKERRFLIVLDDIWNAKTWDDLRRVFPDDVNGSRIIITTRDVDVASYADTWSHTYEMHLMGVDLSWNLLRQTVFEVEHCPPELEEIGREIAEKCRGLPLAIVVIAGVLTKLDRMQHTWKKIARNVNEAVNTSNEPFAEILSLTYTYMPHHLRPCFLYMGAFPEDDEIHVSKLIRLWVAEGFLKPNGSKDLEEVAEDCLEELAKRSLVMINKKRYNGKIKSIKMHDLLRDLCLRKAADEKFLCVINECGSFSIENSRRVSILSNSWGLRNMDDSPIHTLLVSRYWYFEDFERLRLLRVADLMRINFSMEGAGIGELLHLRYLAVICEPGRKSMEIDVPDFLSKLENLQTLIINAPMFSYLFNIPLGIWRMRELRQIIILDGSLPDPSADRISPLEKLHTLKRIHGFRCTKRILELIPNLKKLGITYYSGGMYKKNWSEYGLNNLVHLQKLENLNLYAAPHDYDQSNLFQSLAFPATLKKLTLSGSAIPWEDMSIVASLPNLQVLKLKQHACRGLLWETVEGQFCQLKVLVIDSTQMYQTSM